MRIRQILLLAILLVIGIQGAWASRNDVLVIVNDNSLDSPQVGTYYAQARDIDPTNIVHTRSPNQYFISWSDFQSLRDQILRFGICPTVAPALRPAACGDSSQPIYTEGNVNALTAGTPVRYIVMTRGVPTQFNVQPPQSDSLPPVDNYMRFWLARYFTTDSRFITFKERERSFGDGRGMRNIVTALDAEYAVGRIDGIDLASAKALVDRTIAAEQNGIFGKFYGSAQGDGGLLDWTNASTGVSIYPGSGAPWRYLFGTFNESRQECSDYLSPSHYFAFAQSSTQGRSPDYCFAQFHKGSGNENPPAHPYSRHPQPVDALSYIGSLDGQTLGAGFSQLENWRRASGCATLCSQTSDPGTCRAQSLDAVKELNSSCVGVAPGFIGYQHQSFPLSFFGVWPTGWTPEPGGIAVMDVPRVDSTQGFDDAFSLWYDEPDEVSSPQCYAYSGGVLGNLQSCKSNRTIRLRNNVSVSGNGANPSPYRLQFRYNAQSIPSAISFSSRLVFVFPKASGVACPSGYAGATTDTSCTYTSGASHTLAAGSTAGWELVDRTVTPPANSSGLNFSTIRVEFVSGTLPGGNIGFDTVSLTDTSSGTQLLANGSFSDGHRQTGTGDYASLFVGRLGGTAFWGSTSHHFTNGHAFERNALESLIYFMRGLPLAEAVWFDDDTETGLLYGDPLYSPIAVKFNYIGDDDRIVSTAALSGSARNGASSAGVTTTYAIDYCPGRDFYVCDRGQTWQATGLSGLGSQTSQSFGNWNIAQLPYGDYTLRLAVTSANAVTGKSQTFSDFYPVRNRYSTAEVPAYSISGTIKDTGGQPLPGVSVTINDNYGFSATTTTNASGVYAQVVKSGIYTVSPSRTNYTFTVDGGGNIFQTVNSASVTKDFTGAPAAGKYVISGTIMDNAGQPMHAVSVAINDNYGFVSTVATNASGYYSQAVPNGVYIVSPSKSNYTFSVNGGGNIFQNVNGANVSKSFTGTLAAGNYTISGAIGNSVGQPIVNVAVAINDSSSFSATATTNANGYYSQVVPNGLYIVSPSKTNYTFAVSGGGNVFQSVNGASVSKDFIGTFVAPKYSISGFVLVNGQPLAGVTMQVNDNYGFSLTTTTSANGYYTATGLKNGTYIVNPSKGGYSITADSGNIFQSVNGGNIIDKNFTAVPQ